MKCDIFPLNETCAHTLYPTLCFPFAHHLGLVIPCYMVHPYYFPIPFCIITRYPRKPPPNEIYWFVLFCLLYSYLPFKLIHKDRHRIGWLLLLLLLTLSSIIIIVNVADRMTSNGFHGHRMSCYVTWEYKWHFFDMSQDHSLLYL